MRTDSTWLKERCRQDWRQVALEVLARFLTLRVRVEYTTKFGIGR